MICSLVFVLYHLTHPAQTPPPDIPKYMAILQTEERLKPGDTLQVIEANYHTPESGITDTIWIGYPYTDNEDPAAGESLGNTHSAVQGWLNQTIAY